MPSQMPVGRSNHWATERLLTSLEVLLGSWERPAGVTGRLWVWILSWTHIFSIAPCSCQHFFFILLFTDLSANLPPFIYHISVDWSRPFNDQYLISPCKIRVLCNRDVIKIKKNHEREDIVPIYKQNVMSFILTRIDKLRLSSILC